MLHVHVWQERQKEESSKKANVVYVEESPPEWLEYPDNQMGLSQKSDPPNLRDLEGAPREITSDDEDAIKGNLPEKILNKDCVPTVFTTNFSVSQ